MPVFEYTALDQKGKTRTGIIDAESAFAARQRLRDSSIFPIGIKEATEAAEPEEQKPGIWPPRLLTRVRPSEIAMMTRQLATLIGAGFPLVSAIDSLLTHTKTQSFKKVLANIKDAIVEGNSFANALALYPGIFTPLYVNMVRAGESSGTLEIVLEQLAEIGEKQQALMHRIRSALMYPIFMAFIGAGVLFFLLAVIVPTITSIFTDMGQILPTPTRLLITISNLLKAYWWVMALILIVIWAVVKRIGKTKRGRLFFDKNKLRLPLFGSLQIRLSVARVARTLGSLLANGVPMLTALGIVKNIVDNVHITLNIESAADEVGKGRPLGESLAEGQLLPPLFLQMVKVGEQSGELESMLNKIANVYENEVETNVMSLTSLLEPVMILIMGLSVGFIVLSICLPIFEMTQLVK